MQKVTTNMDFSNHRPDILNMSPAELGAWGKESGDKLSAFLKHMDHLKPQRPSPDALQLPPESFESPDAMRTWVLGGGDVTLCDTKGRTLLFHALQPSKEKTGTAPPDLKLAQFLIEHCVPINAREYETGRTVLMSIMLIRNTDSMLPTLRLLLDHRADPGIADSVMMGQTPISSACGELSLRTELVIRNQFANPILSTLLDAKARTLDAVNGCAVGMHQPLMVAVMHSSLAAVRLLLQAGAKPDGKALAFVTDQVRGVDELSLGGSSLSAKNHLSVAAASKLLMEQFQVLTEEQQAKATLLGRCVVIEGLVTKPELNGRHGNPIFYTPKSKRYSVLLDGTGTELLSLKPSNLLALPEGDYGNFMRHAPSK